MEDLLLDGIWIVQKKRDVLSGREKTGLKRRALKL